LKRFSIFLAAALASAQPATFEVASVKSAVEPDRQPIICLVPCMPGERLTVVGSRVDIRYMSLERLMLTAYGLKSYQLSGPDWMRSQRFDIEAKIPEGVSKDRIPEMLQALLAERFKLSIHRDAKEQPVYALVVAKTGSKLQEAAADASAPLPDSPGAKPLYTPQGDARMLGNGNFAVQNGPFGSVRGGMSPAGMRFEFLNITMPALAEVLMPHTDRPVIDMTGLTGAFHIVSVGHMPEGGGGRKGSTNDAPDPSGPRPDPFGEGLFSAIAKAGLKLEPRKAPVETIVVDRLEKTPTVN
jgi:uncharacterized protein (TIGR03435 family)